MIRALLLWLNISTLSFLFKSFSGHKLSFLAWCWIWGKGDAAVSRWTECYSCDLQGSQKSFEQGKFPFVLRADTYFILVFQWFVSSKLKGSARPLAVTQVQNQNLFKNMHILNSDKNIENLYTHKRITPHDIFSKQNGDFQRSTVRHFPPFGLLTKNQI